jgi:DNA repair exonuclease SbcCD nuclease subunit
MSKDIQNHSKKLSKTDDSAAALLIDLLDGNAGRNFDIESLFVHKREDGRWEFIILEFLKCESTQKNVDVFTSHPNRYWNKNKRKFLSLWTLVEVIKHGGINAKLVLINYDDSRKQIKVMNVKSINQNRQNNWVDTKDECITFNEFKERF